MSEDIDEVNRIARLLIAEWERVERERVNVSYIATFADMARAVVADRNADLETREDPESPIITEVSTPTRCDCCRRFIEPGERVAVFMGEDGAIMHAGGVPGGDVLPGLHAPRRRATHWRDAGATGHRGNAHSASSRRRRSRKRPSRPREGAAPWLAAPSPVCARSPSPMAPASTARAPVAARRRRPSTASPRAERARRGGPVADLAALKMSANQAVHLEVRAGIRPHANTIPCSDCGHVWAAGERRHEWHHHLGYEREHWFSAVVVCTTCHAKHGLKAQQTHCIRGHEFTVENTLRNPNGTRRCRACQTMRESRRAALRKAERSAKRNGQ